MTHASEAIMERAREKRRRRGQKRGVPAQPRTWLSRMIAWGGHIAGAAFFRIRMYLRWATHRKAA
jgi:hypothetical protein